MADSIPTPVIAIVPFSDFGGDDVLVLRSGNRLLLPSGTTHGDERVLEAAARIVRETTGLPVIPVRIVYLLESPHNGISLAVLCSGDELPDDAEGVQGDVVALASIDQDFEPVALRDVLVEDLRSGFVRPVAHIIETLANGRRHVEVSW